MHHPDNAYVLHMLSFFTFDVSDVSDVGTPLSVETRSSPGTDAAIHKGNGADDPSGGIWWALARTDRWVLK